MSSASLTPSVTVAMRCVHGLDALTDEAEPRAAHSRAEAALQSLANCYEPKSYRQTSPHEPREKCTILGQSPLSCTRSVPFSMLMMDNGAVRSPMPSRSKVRSADDLLPTQYGRRGAHSSHPVSFSLSSSSLCVLSFFRSSYVYKPQGTHLGHNT